MTTPLLITTPTNIRYLTGFVGAAPDEREAYVLKTDTQTFLFTNPLYMESARELVRTRASLQVIEVTRENPLSKELHRIVEEQTIPELGFEDTNLTVAEFTKLTRALTETKLIPVRDEIETQRMIKRDDELNAIRKACALGDACFTAILKTLKPGVTESAITWEIESFFRKRGATNAFAPVVAFGKNASQPHYDGNANSALSKNDLVLLDFGCRINGYCSDMTRMVAIGTPKETWAKAYNAVLAAQEKALTMLTDGARSGAALDAAAKEVVTKAGFPAYPHSLGHGVGLDIHEAPRLSIKKDAELAPGMVVSVEPGIYVEGEFGIRIEDLVAITATGIEILTKSTKKLVTR